MSKRKVVFLTMSVGMMILLLAGGLFGQSTEKAGLFRYLSIFSEVFDLVRSNYVDPVPSDQLMDGAFSGVTDAIDEFSYYVPPTQMAAYKKFVEVEDNGVGLVVTKRYGYAYVISALPGSPAAKAGIERGDFIEKVNGTSTQTLAVWQIRNALRAPNTKLQILRGGQTRRDEFVLAPASFHPIPVKQEQIAGIPYISIPYFEENTAEEFATALDALQKAGARKLIVDLRSNAGGDVAEAIQAVDLLLDRGVITSTTGRKIAPKTWSADKDSRFAGELQVLTDQSTAGPAEVFAAAIRGNERGKLVGVPTYGKAILQKFLQLPSGGAVVLTTGYYTTPDSKPIKEQGVRPDVMVDLTVQAIEDSDEPKTKKELRKEDLILQKALALFGAKLPEAVPQKKAA